MPTLLSKAVTFLLLTSGALGAPAATGGPVNNNPRVVIKVKFEPPDGPEFFDGENYTVKYYTKKAVKELFTEDNGIDEDMYYAEKVKWDHGSVDGDYYVAYIYVQFKHGQDDKAQKFYDKAKKFDYENEDSTHPYKTVVKEYIVSKLDYAGDGRTSDDDCSYRFRAAGDIVCTGHYKCMLRDPECSDVDDDCSACTDYEYDDAHHTCKVLELTRNECEVYGSTYNLDPSECRGKYGFFKAEEPMTCTGYGDYVDAYVCNNLKISECWFEEDPSACQACYDQVYYTSAKPVKHCTFTPESNPNDFGKCVTGFCQNDNCYVKKLSVVLENMPEEASWNAGNWINIVYMAIAFLSILVTSFIKPRQFSDSAQLNDMMAEKH